MRRIEELAKVSYRDGKWKRKVIEYWLWCDESTAEICKILNISRPLLNQWHRWHFKTRAASCTSAPLILSPTLIAWQKKQMIKNKKVEQRLSKEAQGYGEGEWKVRKHGVSKRRTWRKLHIAIDIATQEIISVELTGNDEDDAAVADKMVAGKTDKLQSFTGDDAYDDFNFRKTLGNGVKQIIPPPIDAVIHDINKGTKKKPPKVFLEQRNQAIEFIKEHDRKQWKIKENYHKRSRNEVVMFRYKTSFGEHMNARKLENQKTEVILKCKILNTYRKVGMPIACKVA